MAGSFENKRDGMIDTSELPFAKPTRKEKQKTPMSRTRPKQSGKRVVHINGEAVNLRQADVQWANAVKERDHWVCQKCGKEDLANHAHHRCPRGRAPELRYELSNGITLCGQCHDWVHSHTAAATAAGLLLPRPAMLSA